MNKIEMNDRESIIREANSLRWEVGENFHDSLMENIYENAAAIASKVVKEKDQDKDYSFDQKLDKIVTSRAFGFPIMFILLAVVFWLTIAGANVPSQMLASVLIDKIHPFVDKRIVN
jgi:ferrous iron transport protein B